MEAASHNEGMSVDNESSIMSSNAFSKTGEQKEVFYKLATPWFPPEPDWSITLSRNDFPWYDIKFEDYTAQECFDMYRSIITDEDTFNRKVRKEKNAMINKLMKENRKIIRKAKQQGFEAPPLSKKELKKQAEQLKHLREAQLKESSKMHQLQKEMTKEEVAAYNQRIAEQNKMYWYCRGRRGKDPDDFYVACDGPNCENNGWYHWKCIEELRFKTKQELDSMNEWYCPSCRTKQESNKGSEKAEGKKKSEGKFIITLLMLTYLFVMRLLWSRMVTTSSALA